MNRLLALCIVVVIDVLGFGIMVPLVPYMADRFGASPAIITPILGTYSLCQLLAMPLWGRLSDRFGRRPILLSSLGGACLSYLILGYAENIWWLLASRALGGFMAGNLAAALAYASDVSRPQERAKAMGAVGAAIGIGFMMGPAIGGLLAGDDELQANFLRPALVSAALALFAMLLVVFVLRESHTPEQRERHRAIAQRSRPWTLLAAQPGLRWLALAAAMLIFSQSTMESIFAIWSLNRFGLGPRAVGFAMFALALVAVLSQGLLVRLLAPRYGESRLAIAGVIANACGALTIAFSTSFPMVIAGLALIGLGAGCFNPSASALASRQADEGNRGAVMGTYQGGVSAARILAPLSAGAIFSSIGHNAPFVVGGLVALQACWFLLAARPHDRAGV